MTIKKAAPKKQPVLKEVSKKSDPLFTVLLVAKGGETSLIRIKEPPTRFLYIKNIESGFEFAMIQSDLQGQTQFVYHETYCMTVTLQAENPHELN